MDRTKYIGSSDARYILNGDWSRLYRQKLGLDPETPPSFAMRMGAVLEDFHLDATITALNEEKNGGFKYSKTQPDGDQHFAAYHHSEGFNEPLIGSHPDALLRDMGGIIYPLEAKFTTRWRDAEEAADWYMPQIQHHLLCWGVELALFSVIVGTKEPERLWIGASAEWQRHYLDRCDTFWGHVAKEVPPSPLFTDDQKVKVPSAVKDSVPIEGMTRRDMSGNNRFKAIAAEFIETKEAVARHDKAKSDLKKMVGETERELYSDVLTLKRDKRGAIRFTIHETEDS